MGKNGFGLLEIVIAVSIISGTIFSLSYVFIISHRLEAISSDKVRANFLAEEGLEAMRFLRDKSWNTNLSGLSVDTTYYLSFATTTSTWSVVTNGPALIDGLYMRTINVAAVERDASDDIVSSGGTVDPDSKKISVTMAWSGRGATSTVTISTYLS